KSVVARVANVALGRVACLEYGVEVECRPDTHRGPGRVTVAHRASDGGNRVARSQWCDGGIRSRARWSRKTHRRTDFGHESRGWMETSDWKSGDDVVCRVG